MGRSSREEATRTRARIVEAASDLFSHKGANQVSIASLMAQLGMTTGGFYKHFASKEGLVAETYRLAFDRASSRWLANAERQRAEGESMKASLLRYYLRRNPQRRCPMIAFAEDASRAPEDDATRTAYRDGAEELFKRFTDASDTEQTPGDSGHNAKLLFAAMVGVRRLEEAAGDVEWVKEIREAVLEAAISYE